MSNLFDELGIEGIVSSQGVTTPKLEKGDHPLSLLLEYKNVYGRHLYYPACERSKKMIRLITHKSFTEDQVEILQDVGFDIKMAIKHAGRVHELTFTPREKDEADNNRLGDVQ